MLCTMRTVDYRTAINREMLDILCCLGWLIFKIRFVWNKCNSCYVYIVRSEFLIHSAYCTITQYRSISYILYSFLLIYLQKSIYKVKLVLEWNQLVIYCNVFIVNMIFWAWIFNWYVRYRWYCTKISVYLSVWSFLI